MTSKVTVTNTEPSGGKSVIGITSDNSTPSLIHPGETKEFTVHGSNVLSVVESAENYNHDAPNEDDGVEPGYNPQISDSENQENPSL